MKTFSPTMQFQLEKMLKIGMKFHIFHQFNNTKLIKDLGVNSIKTIRGTDVLFVNQITNIEEWLFMGSNRFRIHKNGFIIQDLNYLIIHNFKGE